MSAVDTTTAMRPGHHLWLHMLGKDQIASMLTDARKSSLRIVPHVSDRDQGNLFPWSPGEPVGAGSWLSTDLPERLPDPPLVIC